MKRALALLLVLAALPATAAAQGDPFGPLPPPPAPAAPTPEPVQDPADEGISRTVLLGVGVAVLLGFVGMGMYITRDARRHLSDDDRATLAREREHVDVERRRGEQVKKKARDKTRAQKQARKRQRSRR